MFANTANRLVRAWAAAAVLLCLSGPQAAGGRPEPAYVPFASATVAPVAPPSYTAPSPAPAGNAAARLNHSGSAAVNAATAAPKPAPKPAPTPTPAITDLIATDGNNSTRWSKDYLEVTVRGLGKHAVKLAATPDKGPWPSGQPTWTLDGKACGSGPSITVNIMLGRHTLVCSARNSKTVTVTACLGDPTAYSSPQLDAALRKAAMLCSFVQDFNRKLGGKDSDVKWTLGARGSTQLVDQDKSSKVAKSSDLSLAGGVSLAKEFKYPGLAVDVPYFKAGVFITPSVGVDLSITTRYNAAYNPPRWEWSGQPKASAKVTAKLVLDAGSSKVVKVTGEVAGTASASLQGRLWGPPVQAQVTGTFGQLDASGKLTFTIVNQPVCTWTKTIRVYNGFPIASPVVSLAN